MWIFGWKGRLGVWVVGGWVVVVVVVVATWVLAFEMVVGQVLAMAR